MNIKLNNNFKLADGNRLTQKKETQVTLITERYDQAPVHISTTRAKQRGHLLCLLQVYLMKFGRFISIAIALNAIYKRLRIPQSNNKVRQKFIIIYSIGCKKAQKNSRTLRMRERFRVYKYDYLFFSIAAFNSAKPAMSPKVVFSIEALTFLIEDLVASAAARFSAFSAAICSRFASSKIRV